MKNAKSRRQLTMITLIIALGVAVYLNWQYAKSNPLITEDGQTQAVAAGAQQSDSSDTINDILDNDSTGNKNYGDAQLVSAGAQSVDDYFEQAAYNRTKNRDEALDKLQKSLKNAKLTQDEKEQLTAELTALLTGITNEGDIENMVTAKGFERCLVTISGEKVNVAVANGGNPLTAEQVAQIRDIILSKTEVEVKNITIVEVK